jgi:hypothetical protein
MGQERFTDALGDVFLENLARLGKVVELMSDQQSVEFEVGSFN